MSGSASGAQGKPRRRLHQSGFTDVEVRDRPSWLAREHALWKKPSRSTLARILRCNPCRGGREVPAVDALLRRVLAVATNPR